MIVNYLFAENIISLFDIVFFVGYLIIAISTGIYINRISAYASRWTDVFAGYFPTYRYKKARLMIEFIGFVIMILAHGKFGVGTVIMTITCG